MHDFIETQDYSQNHEIRFLNLIFTKCPTKRLSGVACSISNDFIFTLHPGRHLQLSSMKISDIRCGTGINSCRLRSNDVSVIRSSYESLWVIWCCDGRSIMRSSGGVSTDRIMIILSFSSNVIIACSKTEQSIQIQRMPSAVWSVFGSEGMLFAICLVLPDFVVPSICCPNRFPPRNTWVLVMLELVFGCSLKGWKKRERWSFGEVTDEIWWWCCGWKLGTLGLLAVNY